MQKTETRPTKNCQLNIRFTSEQRELLERKAGQAKLSFAKYITQLIESRPIVTVDFFPEFIRELNKIGVNINQIAHKANSQKFVSAELKKSLDMSIKTVEKIRSDIFEKIEKLKNANSCGENYGAENAKIGADIEEIKRGISYLVGEKKENEKWLL